MMFPLLVIRFSPKISAPLPVLTMLIYYRKCLTFFLKEVKLINNVQALLAETIKQADKQLALNREAKQVNSTTSSGDKGSLPAFS